MTRTSEEGSGTVVGGKLIFELGSHGPRDRILLEAVAALGELHGQGFVPEGRLDSSFLSGDRCASRVTMTHPRFTGSDDYANSWLSLSVDTYEPEPWEVIFLSIHMGKPGEQLDVEWDVGLAVMPRLVRALRPSLAYMNAWSLDTDGGTFPPGAPARDFAIPRRFTAWTYLGSGLGDDKRRSLGRLPAVESAALGDGWLVRAVEHVRDVPQEDFLSALAALGDPAIDYQPPNLDARR